MPALWGSVAQSAPAPLLAVAVMAGGALQAVEGARRHCAECLKAFFSPLSCSCLLDIQNEL